MQVLATALRECSLGHDGGDEYAEITQSSDAGDHGHVRKGTVYTHRAAAIVLVVIRIRFPTYNCDNYFLLVPLRLVYCIRTMRVNS